ncbi:MAG TPA: hypothetical protein PLP01_00335 [Phycisphaerae bacterium]|nr:hypothetical protein [Phycisphaerae bacterium]
MNDMPNDMAADPEASAAPTPPAPIIEMPEIRRTASPAHLLPPMVWLWVVFRPWALFRRQARRQSLGSAITSVAINVTVMVAIITVSILSEEHISGDEWYGLLFGMAAVWVVGLAFAVCVACATAPAMSCAATFAAAVRRSAPIVAGMTSVFPVATLLFALIVINEGNLRREWLRPVFGDNSEFPMIVAGGALCFWPLWLLWLGLRNEGYGLPTPMHETGHCRCERCGYDLTVTSDQGTCPECGHAAELSTDGARRKLPRPERHPGKAPLGMWLAAFWHAALRPATFWADKRVRTDGSKARNASLTLTALSATAAGLIFFVLFGMVLALTENVDPDDLWPLAVVSLFVFACAFMVLLLGNPAIALAAVCVSRLRGNTSRLDELGRLAWYSVSAPQIVFCVAGAMAAAIGPAAEMISGYRAQEVLHLSHTEAAFAQTMLILLACGCGAIALGALVWSFVAAVRAMRATAHANF